jgi:hypothetical protein
VLLEFKLKAFILYSLLLEPRLQPFLLGYFGDGGLTFCPGWLEP